MSELREPINAVMIVRDPDTGNNHRLRLIVQEVDPETPLTTAAIVRGVYLAASDKVAWTLLAEPARPAVFDAEVGSLWTDPATDLVWVRTAGRWDAEEGTRLAPLCAITASTGDMCDASDLAFLSHLVPYAPPPTEREKAEQAVIEAAEGWRYGYTRAGDGYASPGDKLQRAVEDLRALDRTPQPTKKPAPSATFDADKDAGSPRRTNESPTSFDWDRADGTEPPDVSKWDDQRSEAGESCPAQSRSLWLCSKELGHSGPHTRRVGETLCAVWGESL